jgi:hypothetical protein
MIAIAMVLGLLASDVAVILWCAGFRLHRVWWQYGTFRNGTLARRHRMLRNVQFVLTTQGRSAWRNSDASWWSTFVPGRQ